jgi:hypothetical protein
MRRLRAGLVTPPPGGLGSPSVPTKRDCPSVGWTRRGRRRAKACRIGEGAALPSAPGSYGSGDRNRRSGAPRGAPPSPRRRRASPGVSGGFAGRPGACAKPPRFSALRSLKGGADWTTAYPGRQEYGRFCARASPSPGGGGIRKNAVLRWPLLFGYIRALSRSG